MTTPWSPIIDATRATDWSSAGVEGGIPTGWTQCGSTIAAYTGPASTINSAIAACADNTYVLLGPGAFNLSSGILVQRSNVALRGSGPNSTTLNFSGVDSCGGFFTTVCYAGAFEGAASFTGGPTNWTAGFTQGTTVITLASTTGLTAGMYIMLDQLNDVTDSGGLNSSDASGFSIEGGCIGRTSRCQNQLVRVTNVSGTSVTITPGIQGTNWRIGQTPQAWWVSQGGSPPSLSLKLGIENLTIDASGIGDAGTRGITFWNAANGWTKNIRSIRAGRSHIGFSGASHIEVRDSYLFSTKDGTGGSQSYGIECQESSDILVINNILEALSGGYVSGNCTGTVLAYNYGLNALSSPQTFGVSFLIPSHDAGAHQQLYEGNDSPGFISDTFHGAGGNQITYFRNFATGFETGKTGALSPMIIWANNRAHNVVGNVLGTTGIQTSYQTQNSATIFDLGCAAFSNCASYNGVVSDSVVASSLLRWGNYDTFNAASRFVSGEIPTTGITYIAGNPVPNDNILPKSFYLGTSPTRPTWFATPWGTPAWPPIGPDVTCSGGNCISGVASHVDKIPARLCYENLSSTSGVKNFDANTCYNFTSISNTIIPGGLTIRGGWTFAIPPLLTIASLGGFGT